MHKLHIFFISFIIRFIPVCCNVFVYVIVSVFCFVYYGVLVVLNNDVHDDPVNFQIPSNIFHTVNAYMLDSNIFSIYI